MPQFEYRAIDSLGKPATGRVVGLDLNDAVRQLSAQGMRLQSIKPAVAAPAAVAPAVQRAVSPAIQTRSQSVAAPVLQPKTSTAFANLKDNYFLFIQLSNLLRSGIAPVNALTDLAARQHKRGFRTALEHIAELSSQGTAMSTAMSLYPAMFPQGAVGAVAAGEAGGYLWEACERVAMEAKRLRRIKLMFDWVGVVFWSNLIFFPLVWVGNQAIDGAIASINAPGTSPLALMGSQALKALFGPAGLASLALLILYIALKRSQSHPATKPIRDKLSARLPLIGGFVKGENGSSFAWHLERLGRAGISPHRSWSLAASAVPNATIAEDLQASVPAMNEASRLSEGFVRTSLFPPEIGHVMQTGEMTGQVGRALEDAREMSDQKANMMSALLMLKGVTWIVLISMAAAALTYAFLLRGYFDSAFNHVLEEEPAVTSGK